MSIIANFLCSCVIYLSWLQNPFLPNVKVNQLSHDFTEWPSIAVSSSGIIYVAYNVRIGWVPPESTHIYLNVSYDSGETFEPEIMVIQGTKHAEAPSLQVDNNNILHMTYENTPNAAVGSNVFYACSFDSGKTFPLRTKVDDNPGLSWIGMPEVAVDDSGFIYIVWNDFRTAYSHVYFSRSIDGGISFSTDMRIDTGSVIVEGYHQCIETNDQGNIYIVWRRQDSNGADIYLRKSSNHGSTFGEIIEVANTSYNLGLPDIATMGNDTILVSCIGGTDTTVLFISRSSDGGNVFGNPQMVNDSIDEYCYWNRICVTQDRKIHLVWQMMADVYNEQYADIFYDFSTDKGLTFNEDIMVNDNTADSARSHPTLAKDIGGNIYVAWQDWRSWYDIFFARTDFQGITETKKKPAFPAVLDIYPNPFIRVTSIQPLNGGEGKESGLTIYDAGGRLVKSIRLETNTSELGADLVPGIYFLKLKAGDHTETHKLIKIR